MHNSLLEKNKSNKSIYLFKCIVIYLKKQVLSFLRIILFFTFSFADKKGE